MKQNLIIKWSLILAIVIIANLFFNYSLSLIFNGPDRDEFCPFEKTSQVIENKQACEAADGIWNPGQVIVGAPEQTLKVAPAGYCDLYSKCENKFREASKTYEQKVFIGLIIIGAVVLIASAFLKVNTVLSSSFALTAVLDLIVASFRYWRYSQEWLKVSILFVALVILIYIVVKKFKEHSDAGIQS